MWRDPAQHSAQKVPGAGGEDAPDQAGPPPEVLPDPSLSRKAIQAAWGGERGWYRGGLEGRLPRLHSLAHTWPHRPGHCLAGVQQGPSGMVLSRAGGRPGNAGPGLLLRLLRMGRGGGAEWGGDISHLLRVFTPDSGWGGEEVACRFPCLPVPLQTD